MSDSGASSTGVVSWMPALLTRIETSVRRLCCCGHGVVVGDVEDQWNDPVVVALRLR